MQTRNQKGLKPFIIKYLAVLVGIFYLINPLQEPLQDFLHGISHSLKAPTTLISHTIIVNSEHRSLDHHDSYEHQMSHDHDLIDFISTIFEASNQPYDSDKSLFKELKVDKHITTARFSISPLLKVKRKLSFLLPLPKVYSDYVRKLKKPPQLQIG